MAGVSFDTGVLIGLERGEHAAWAWLKRAAERGKPPLVSAVAVAEASRGGARSQPLLARALRACDVRPLDERLARMAGAALASVGGGAGTVDAIVAATAADAGALLVTGDPDDMAPLAERHFRALRLAILRHA